MMAILSIKDYAFYDPELNLECSCQDNSNFSLIGFLRWINFCLLFLQVLYRFKRSADEKSII